VKFDRSITFLFALASFFIFASDDVRATLDQTDTISPAENGGTPALHVIGIYEGTTPKDGDNRLLSNRCNGDLGNKQQHAPPFRCARSVASIEQMPYKGRGERYRKHHR
jgi:hypothetical protein